jgi:hypothetical protein
VTVQADLSGVSAVSRVTFAASYLSGNDTRQRATGDYALDTAVGNATLTGIDVTVDDDGRVAIGGNLANVGDGDVSSAIVAVEATDTVQPAYPQRTYFVGTVAESEFAPFELAAQADAANATTVTVRLAYTAAGERVTDRVTVPLPADDGTDLASAQQSLGPAALMIGGLAVTVSLTLLLRRRLGER